MFKTPKHILMNKHIDNELQNIEFSERTHSKKIKPILSKLKNKNLKSIIEYLNNPENKVLLNDITVKHDFLLIIYAINYGLNQEVIEYLLSIYIKDNKYSKKYACYLMKLLRESKMDMLELFLKNGFDINGTMYFEKDEYNLLFYEINFDPFEEDVFEKFIFLLDHGIDINALINYDINFTHRTDLNNEYNTIIDFLIQTFFKYDNMVSYKALKLIFDYCKKKEKENDDNDQKKNIIDLSILNSDTHFSIMLNDKNLMITDLIVEYYGYEEFNKSEFFNKMIFLVNMSGNQDYLTKIGKKNYSRQKEKEVVLPTTIFKEIKDHNFNNIKKILKLNKNIINIKNSEDNDRTPLMYTIQYCIDYPEILDLILQYYPNKNVSEKKNNSTVLHIACQFNNHKAIPKLITSENINSKDKNNNTPLMVALKYWYFDCAIAILTSSKNQLFQYNINLKDNHNQTPIHYLLSNDIINQPLFEHLIHLENINNENYLYYMLKNNIENELYFSLLIKNKMSIEIKQFEEQDGLLSYMINNQSFNKAIIKNGFYILENDQTLKFISNPIIFSINRNLLDLLKSILNNYDEDKDKMNTEKDKNHKTFLFYAIDHPNIDYFTTLINNEKINIEEKNDQNITPLMYSLKKQEKEKVKLLLLKYIDKYEKLNNNSDNNNNNNLLEINQLKEQLDSNFTKIYEELLNVWKKINNNNNNKDNNEDNNKIIDDNNNNFQYENIKRIIKLKSLKNENNHENNHDILSYVNHKNNDNNNNKEIMEKCQEVHLVCLNENEELIQLLIQEFNYNINEPSLLDGSTPLLLSIKYEKYKCIPFLLENGADITIPNQQGESAISYILKHPSDNEKYKEILKLFIPKINFYQTYLPNNLLPFQYLINYNNWQGLEVILPQLNTLNINIDDYNLINYKKMNNNKKEKEKEKENEKNDDNLEDTLLLYAIKLNTQNLKLIKTLLSNGANINYLNKQGKNALIYAIEQKNMDLIKLLMNYKPDIKLKTKNGITPLKLAIMNNLSDIVRELLSTNKKR
ncbi:ankyrin [Anaeromyces robustus]|uniref:Ankyrin n=1 Tax=Anaeromyces robustus TaxID=1754192 RepID=A0A1Y1X806_9FUNG|nr:ankyrin [Anaeromyces robustus]|eukprot:ORX81901.1 ankyrin [Anaeromyces robustus]